MPSGGIDSTLCADREEAGYVLATIKDAYAYGLQYEFMEWFIGGMRQGMNPIDAAFAAAIEWDF